MGVGGGGVGRRDIRTTYINDTSYETFIRWVHSHPSFM